VKNESANPAASTAGANKAPGLPAAVDRAAFQAELDALREREKAHTLEGDAIAAARRRLPMVEVDASLTLPGPLTRKRPVPRLHGLAPAVVLRPGLIRRAPHRGGRPA
jgi:hypothetical protein